MERREGIVSRGVSLGLAEFRSQATGLALFEFASSVIKQLVTGS